MDDSLKTLDLSAEGTVSVPSPSPVVDTPPAPQPTIVTQSSGPTDKKPMGKKTKIVAGVLSVLVLLSGLGVGIFLSKQKQNVVPKAFSPGNCRCSGTSWICENESGGHDYIREEPSCTTGTPPSSEETKVTNPNTGVTTTTSQTTTFTNPTTGTTTTQTFTGATTPGSTVVTTVNTTGSSAGGVPVTDGVGGVKANNRTGACGQCGGLNQGGCDNNPTSYTSGGVTTTGPGCGFGCLGGLHFCTNSGSCQASCPPGAEAVGPCSSNQNACTCLTTGVGCNVANSTQNTAGLSKLTSGVSGTTTSTAFNPNVNVNLTFGLKNPCYGKTNDAACNGKTTNQYLSLGVLSADKKTLIFTGAELKQAWPNLKISDSFQLTVDMVTRSFNRDQLGQFLTALNSSLTAGQYWVASAHHCADQTTLVGGCINSNPFTLTQALFTSGNTLGAAGGCGVDQLDIDGGGGHLSVNFLNVLGNGCGTTTTTTTTNTPTGGTNPTPSNPPSGSNPTPTPTTTTQSYACYQLSIMKNGNNISAASVQVGDSLVMRGFATATNTTVSKMRFVVSINGVAQAPVDVNASLISGMYQADMPYTITQAASYSVTTAPISP